MIFLRPYIPVLCAAALFTGCFQSPKPSREKTARMTADIAPLPFTPPADSSITPAQFAAWFACNRRLDSLSQTLAGPSAGKVVPCDSVRQIFCKAQDRICVANGLTSGYAEYEWITDNLGNSRNKAVYDSMMPE
jgi:hypothetical protein